MAYFAYVSAELVSLFCPSWSAVYTEEKKGYFKIICESKMQTDRHKSVSNPSNFIMKLMAQKLPHSVR